MQVRWCITCLPRPQYIDKYCIPPALEQAVISLSGAPPQPTAASSNWRTSPEPATGFSAWLATFWNRGLPAEVYIQHRVIWPLFLVPIAIFNQLVAPHPVWIVLLVGLLGLYGSGLAWVRSQARAVTIERRRLGAVLIAGDTLREAFTLQNRSIWPVLWAEFIDHSTLLGYAAGRVVGCGGMTHYRWTSTVECRQRGVYRLGPHELVLGDPLGLFRVTMHDDGVELVVIYPQVVHLPVVALPHGDTSGTARRRRPLSGPLPSASVRDYRATDSLRYVHWRSTAHRGSLMVKELEIEPSGGVWIVLDLNRAAHKQVGEIDTLEFSVVVAASLAAELIGGPERRTVGLLTVSDHDPLLYALNPGEASEPDLPAQLLPTQTELERAVVVSPLSGPAQLWRILAALAPVAATELPLAELLRTSRRALGRRGTVVIITPQAAPLPGAEDWTAELLHLESTGLASSVILITLPDGDPTAADVADTQAALGNAVRQLLARHDVPVQVMPAGTRLPAALTFRRKRTVVRNTPTGGVVTYEIEDEVG